MVDDDEQSGERSWHDEQRIAIAGGIAAALLLALLIYGVVRVSRDSSTPPPAVVFPTSSTPTSPVHSSGLKTPPSTSYELPGAQPTTAPSESESPPAEPGGPPVVDAPTTIYNPYTTTTTTNAGHI